MIQTLAQDLKIILGRLGSWPHDFAPEAGIQLVALASQHLHEGGMAVDLTPSAGKSTVLLAAAAFRTRAHVTAIVSESMHPAERQWFQRAMRLFKLQDTVYVATGVADFAADLIVARNDELLARQAFASSLKVDGILIGLNIAKLDSIAPEQAGNGWAVWRKPKVPELRLVPRMEPAIPTGAAVAIPLPDDEDEIVTG